MNADRYLGLDTGGTGIKWVVTDWNSRWRPRARSPPIRSTSPSAGEGGHGGGPRVGRRGRSASPGRHGPGRGGHRRPGRGPSRAQSQPARLGGQRTWPRPRATCSARSRPPWPTTSTPRCSASTAQGAGRGCRRPGDDRPGHRRGRRRHGRRPAGDRAHHRGRRDRPHGPRSGRPAVHLRQPRLPGSLGRQRGVSCERARAAAAAGAARPEVAALVANAARTLDAPRTWPTWPRPAIRDAVELFSPRPAVAWARPSATWSTCSIPDRVIIGGGVARAGELILGPCRAAVADRSWPRRARARPIVAADWAPLAAAVGAACLAREKGPPVDRWRRRQAREAAAGGTVACGCSRWPWSSPCRFAWPLAARADAHRPIARLPLRADRFIDRFDRRRAASPACTATSSSTATRSPPPRDTAYLLPRPRMLRVLRPRPD